MKKYLIPILIGIGLISVLFTVFQKNPTPPCFNSDEASFSYNAYSILKTGKDEYGAFLPLRLKSFGDYKMPLFSYLSIPFIAIFGLNEFGARSLNIVLSFILPFAVYGLSLELFRNKKIAVIAAFLTSLSLGLHIIARQAHEAYLATFLTTVASYFFVKVLTKKSWTSLLLFALSSLLLLFSYHPGRLFVLFFFVFAVIYATVKKQKIASLLIMLIVVGGLFGITDLMYKPERLKNLAFFNNAGFTLKIAELKTEGGIRYLYNPLFMGLKDTFLQHLSYFSPQFLLINGDDNYRFGYPGMGIFTPVEYVFVFIGIYYLFKNKERWRWFILSLIFISPLSSSLSWAGGSLTRSLFLLIPLFCLAAYGFVQLMDTFHKRQKIVIQFAALGLFLFFTVFAWDFYLFHYSKRITTIHAWQCGYGQVNAFIKNNYDKYDTFYVTRDIGMPYIFTLFYLDYPPEKYQAQAHLSAPDEYGFGQVEGFDKFKFNFVSPVKVPIRSAVIGSIDNFKDTQDVDKSRLQTISVNGEPMFQIYAK